MKEISSMTHDELVDEVVRRKVAIRVEDAESCTSHEREYDQLIRYGCVNLTTCSNDELRGMVEEYRERETEREGEE